MLGDFGDRLFFGFDVGLLEFFFKPSGFRAILFKQGLIIVEELLPNGPIFLFFPLGFGQILFELSLLLLVFVSFDFALAFEVVSIVGFFEFPLFAQ